MGDARASAHHLHLSREDLAFIPQIVLMGHRAFHHDSDDLCVLVGMRREARSWRHSVVVQNAKHAETHPRRIVPIGETETIASRKPLILTPPARSRSVD